MGCVCGIFLLRPSTSFSSAAIFRVSSSVDFFAASSFPASAFAASFLL